MALDVEQNGTADMSVPAYSPLLNMRYIAVNYSPAAHPIAQGGNSLRQIGGYQTGGIVGAQRLDDAGRLEEAIAARRVAAEQPARHGDATCSSTADGRLAHRDGRGDRR